MALKVYFNSFKCNLMQGLFYHEKNDGKVYLGYF